MNNLSLLVKRILMLLYAFFQFSHRFNIFFKIKRENIYGTNRKNEWSVGSIFYLSVKITKNVIGSLNARIWVR